MSQNNSQQNKPLGNTPDASPSETKQTGMVIVTDFALWNYLFQGYVNQGAHRYSRAEAFFDLVNRQRLAYLTGDGEFLEAGIQQLANVWSWDRTSVRKFIGSLCELGAASIETKANRTCIRLTNIEGSDLLGHLTHLSLSPSNFVYKRLNLSRWPTATPRRSRGHRCRSTALYGSVPRRSLKALARRNAAHSLSLICVF